MRITIKKYVNYNVMDVIKKSITSTRYGAYMTLEMTCIMPFVIFLICNIYFLAVFLYDNSTIVQGDYVTALIAERAFGDEKREKAEIKYNESVKSKMVAAEEISTINIGSNGVGVETQIYINTPAGFIYKSDWGISNKTKVEKYEPVLFLRNTKVAMDLMRHD